MSPLLPARGAACVCRVPFACAPRLLVSLACVCRRTVPLGVVSSLGAAPSIVSSSARDNAEVEEGEGGTSVICRVRLKEVKTTCADKARQGRARARARARDRERGR